MVGPERHVLQGLGNRPVAQVPGRRQPAPPQSRAGRCAVAPGDRRIRHGPAGIPGISSCIRLGSGSLAETARLECRSGRLVRISRRCGLPGIAPLGAGLSARIERRRLAGPRRRRGCTGRQDTVTGGQRVRFRRVGGPCVDAGSIAPRGTATGNRIQVFGLGAGNVQSAKPPGTACRCGGRSQGSGRLGGCKTCARTPAARGNRRPRVGDPARRGGQQD